MFCTVLLLFVGLNFLCEPLLSLLEVLRRGVDRRKPVPVFVREADPLDLTVDPVELEGVTDDRVDDLVVFPKLEDSGGGGGGGGGGGEGVDARDDC